MNIVKALLGYTTQRFMAAVGFPDISTTSGTGWGFLNRTSFNYQSVRPEANSIVMAGVGWAQRNVSEAPLILESWNDQRKDYDQHQHDDFLALLNVPNPAYPGETLLTATVADYMLNGNAYWIKVRSTTGRVVQYWWVPSAFMAPVGLPNDDTVFIDHYECRPGGKLRNYSPADVIHFRDGIDPTNPRKGLSPMGSLFREILTDDEAANMTAALLINFGVPGVIISPEHGTIGPEAAEKIKEMYQAKFTGDHRGEALVMAGQTKIQQFGWSPEQMQLRNLRGIPEERITARMGINSAVLNLGSGLASTKVGAPQPLSARLWTPTGPITMGDAQLGQLIATPRGWEPIEAVYPQGEQDIYRITFQDGSTAESTLDHLWLVSLPDKRRPSEATLQLADIAQFPLGKLQRTAVPLQCVVEFDEQPTLIPPYILGLLLGDGTFRHQFMFSNTASEIVEAFAERLPTGYTLQHASKGDYRINYDDHAAGRGKGNGSGNIHPMKDELRRLGLWMKYSHEKFIPDIYKYNSSEVRREVLRGLLDSDGFVNHHGQPAIEQTSAQLADDVTWMVQSLGGYTLQHRKKANTNTRLIAGRPMASKHDRYYQSIVIDDAASLFRYSYKKDRCRPRVKAATRKFRSIEFVRREDTQCISMPGGLYITDNFIVTHNTLREYREEAFESFMIPLWKSLSAHLTQQGLIPDFRSAKSGWRVSFDLTKVRVLQEDEHKRADSLGKRLDAGGITVAEYRRALGMIALPEHELYLRKNGVTPVPAGLSPEEQAKIAKESTSTGAGRPLEGSVAAREAINKVEELLNL